MAYNAQFDLRGKRIQDTYTQVVQYDSSSGVAYTGQGSSLDLSSSFATTSSFASKALTANVAISASYAPASPTISASYAAQADHATLAAGLDEGAYGASSSLYGPFLSGEVSIDGINTHRALYLDQYSVVKASTMTSTDLGYATGLTSSVQGQLDDLRTGSGVVHSVSSSFSDLATVASQSLTLRGLIVEIPAANTSSAYPTILLGSVVTNESHPHAVITENNKAYAGGWDGNLYVLNDPDGDVTNITTASGLLSPRDISQVCFSDVTGYLYFIVSGDYPGTPSTASIVKVDPTTLSQSLFYDGISNGTPGTTGFGLPPIVCNGAYLFVPSANGDFLKIDASTGALISSSTWVSGSTVYGAHAASMDDSGDFFIVTSGGGTCARVNTSNLAYTTANIGVGSITDDFAILGDYFYPTCEGNTAFAKVNKNTLSSSIVGAYMNSYGTFTDGVHLYMCVHTPDNEVWVYPYGDVSLGPIRYTVPAGPNELWFTAGGRVLSTGWTTTTVYANLLPLMEVGINKTPSTTLDVAGTIQAPWIKSTSQLEGFNIRFSGSLSNTASNVSITQTNVRIGQYTGSNPIGSSGIKVAFISASVITASQFVGTSSWAVSASWAPSAGGGTTLITASTYDITSSWAVNTDSSSYLQTIGGGVTIEPSSVRIDGNAGESGISIGKLELQGTGVTNDGWVGQNEFDSGTGFVRRADGYTGLLEFRNPLFYIKMGDYGVSGSSVSPQTTQLKVNGYTNTLSIGGNVNTFHSTWTGATLIASGSGQVSINKGALADAGIVLDVNGKTVVSSSVTATQGFTGSLFGTASNAVSASWAPSSGGGTTLVTASTYQITSSWAVNVVNGANQVSVSWASASISASYASQSFYAFTANYATATDFATNASLAQTALVADEASASISSSWSSASISSSYSEYSDFALESDVSSTSTSASFASRSFAATSASWASSSISSSYATTASYAANAAGTVLTTGSTYQITASWAVNVVNGGGGSSATQSSVDVSMKDMQFPFTAAFTGITPALLSGASIDNNYPNRFTNGTAQGLVYWMLTFRNENIAGGNEAGNGITASLGFHQMRTPINYNPAGGVTHSFQYFAVGSEDSGHSPIDGEIPGANNKVYWSVDCYALTSSTATGVNFFSAPKLIGIHSVTQSFSGASHESGSFQTVSSSFSDAALTNDCMFFFNVKRINSDSSSVYDPGTPVGDRTDYTGSVAMVSSRISFNLS